MSHSCEMSGSESSGGDAGVRYAQVAAIRLAYETFGDPARPPVLLVMGMGIQMIGWHEDFCERLAARGHYVIRFDNRDSGLSTHLGFRRGQRRPYGLRDLAADTAGLITALGLDSVHLVGISMGGMVAQLVTIENPALVRSLTCIASTTGSRRVGWARPGVALRIPLRRRVRSREEAAAQFVTLFRALGTERYRVEYERLWNLGARSFDRGLDPGGSLRHLSAVVTARNRTRGLRRVTVPSVVIHGDADPLVHVSGGRAIAAAIPGCRLVPVAGMGHDLPPQLWDLIVDEIAAVVAAGEALPRPQLS
jgi:pimeloyl-ACP methyl ester carboxylesterase